MPFVFFVVKIVPPRHLLGELSVYLAVESKKGDIRPGANLIAMIIREAQARDIPALERVKALGGAAHADRVTQAHDTPMRVLVAEEQGEVVGYAFILVAAPPFWTPRFVPQLVDLQVREDWRSHGVGSMLVRAAEALVRAHGDAALYLAVDPDDNPRALALYRRLGYVAVDEHPVDEPWEFADSSGVVHSGLDHVIYMRKNVTWEHPFDGRRDGYD